MMRMSHLASYVREAARLRHAMTLNEDDFEFSEKGGSIHYILDANVVRMFVDPSSNTDILGPFAKWLDEETSTATATVTAEFLLSKALPGHPDDEPSVMAPEHFQEVVNLAAKAKAKIDALSDDEFVHAQNELDQRGQKIKALSDDLEKRGLKYSEKVERLRLELPGLLQDLFAGPLSEISQLRRALENQSLGRIDTQRWYHLAEMPSSADEDDWARKIYQASNRPTSNDSHDQGISYNLIADAKSLALIADVIEDHRDDESTRFVFVTAHKALLRATEAYIKELIDDPKKERGGLNVFVRHPREFLPLINLSTINKNETGFRRIFHEVKRVLDSLLTGIPPVTLEDEGYRFREPTDEEIKQSLAIQGSSNDMVDELERVWSSASKSALASSVGLLEERDADIFKSIADLVETKNVRKDIERKILDDLDRLIEDHSGLTIQGVFEFIERRLVLLRDNGVDRYDAALRVKPYFIDSAIFSDLLADRDLESVLLGAARGEDLEELQAQLKKKSADSELYLLLACLCQAVGLWDAAKDFANRALQLASAQKSPPAFYDDILFIYATSYRLGLRSMTDFNIARRAIHNGVDYLRKKPNYLLLQRIQSEEAALLIGLVEQDLLSTKVPSSEFLSANIDLEQADIDRYMGTAATRLNQVRQALLDDVTGDPSVKKLMVQVVVNSAAYSIISSFKKTPYLKKKLEISDEVIIQELDKILEEDLGVSQVTRPYRLVLGALIGANGDMRLEEVTSFLLKRSDEDLLPRTDKALLKFFSEEVRRHAAHSS